MSVDLLDDFGCGPRPERGGDEDVWGVHVSEGRDRQLEPCAVRTRVAIPTVVVVNGGSKNRVRELNVLAVTRMSRIAVRSESNMSSTARSAPRMARMLSNVLVLQGVNDS